MTVLATDPSLRAAHPPTAPSASFWPVLGLSLVAVLFVSLPNIADPMIRYDDYPALLADPAGFWAKTLHEGRWINYLWHLRGLVTPAWLNFLVYQVLWAVFAASLAMVALGRQGPLWSVPVAALLILVAPPATLISLWFNTLIPGLGIVALYALLGLFLPQAAHRSLLPVFVVLSFMAYTTYPLLILIVCLLRTERRSVVDLARVLMVFAASFVAAVLVVYTINYQVHGIFGVPLASWRDAAPADDVAGLLANLPLVASSFWDLLETSSFGFAPAIWFHLAMLGASTVVLARHAPREALYLHAGLWTGMALVAVQIVKLGVIVPPRGFIFAWVIYAVLIARAVQILSREPGFSGRIARNLAFLILGSYALQTFQQYATYRGWQAETRTLAAQVAAVEGPVTLEGNVLEMPTARTARIQNEEALRFRMRQLTGRAVVLCRSDCSGETVLKLPKT